MTCLAEGVPDSARIRKLADCEIANWSTRGGFSITNFTQTKPQRLRNKEMHIADRLLIFEIFTEA